MSIGVEPANLVTRQPAMKLDIRNYIKIACLSFKFLAFSRLYSNEVEPGIYPCFLNSAVTCRQMSTPLWPLRSVRQKANALAWAQPLGSGRFRPFRQFKFRQTRVQKGANMGRLVRPASIDSNQSAMESFCEPPTLEAIGPGFVTSGAPTPGILGPTSHGMMQQAEGDHCKQAYVSGRPDMHVVRRL